jgi:hypothetical protein
MHIEQCQNCGYKIGQLETPFLWSDAIVCRACYAKLASAAAPLPRPVTANRSHDSIPIPLLWAIFGTIAVVLVVIVGALLTKNTNQPIEATSLADVVNHVPVPTPPPRTITPQLSNDKPSVQPIAEPPVQAQPESLSNRQLSLSDIRKFMKGTFYSGPTSGADLSFTFEYPRYLLNPSTTTVWASGNTGVWDVAVDDSLLDDSEKEKGWFILIVYRPDDINLGLPLRSKVRLDFDEHNQPYRLVLATFFGNKNPDGSLMQLYKKD